MDAFARGATPADGGTIDATDNPAPTTAPDGGGELQEQRDKYLRLAAEYDNYRKRTNRERHDAGARAQHVDHTSVDAATILQGVDMVERKLL